MRVCTCDTLRCDCTWALNPPKWPPPPPPPWASASGTSMQATVMASAVDAVTNLYMLMVQLLCERRPAPDGGGLIEPDAMPHAQRGLFREEQGPQGWGRRRQWGF